MSERDSGLRAKVVMDTSVIRSVIHRDACVAEWERLHSLIDRFHFALFETSLSELFAQLLNGQVDWARWLTGRRRLASVIDHVLPCLALIDDPHWNMKSKRLKRADNRHYLKLLYCHLLGIDAMDELFEIECADMFGGKSRFGRADVDAVFREQREWLANQLDRFVADARAAGVSLDAKELSAMVLSVFPGEPRRGAEAWVRMMLKFASMRAKPRNPYNPRAEKRKGDAFDLMLLVALSIPAYILTEDRSLIERLRQADFPHWRRVMTFRAFLRHVDDGSLPVLFD